MKRILVVDDDLQMRKLLEIILSHYGYEVEAVADGEKAHETIIKKMNDVDQVPDLVITDLNMPRMSGEELAKKLEI